MRRTTIKLAIVAALVALAGATVVAQQPASPPIPVQTIAGTAKTPKTTTATAKTGTKKAGASTKKKSVKNAKKKTTAAKAHAKPSTKPAARSASNAAATQPAPWKPNNPIAEQLSTKPTEVARARRVLPAGTDLNAATVGFKNYSQFAAALNATQSKSLDFGKLKALMTGINMDGTRTNQPTMSLSQATQTLHGTATTPPGGFF